MLVTTVAWAQEVKIAPLLKSGDEFRLEITRVREDAERPQQNSKGTTLVDVRVVSATSEGLTLDWVPGDTQIAGSQIAANPLLRAASDALRGLRLRLALGAEGSYSGLSNETEVLAQLQEALTPMLRGLLDNIPSAERETLEKVLRQTLSPAVMVASVTRDAQTYFSLNGVSIAVGEAIEAEVRQPNPLGGSPLPATVRISLESATADSCVVTMATTYDPAALLGMTRGFAEQLGKPIPEQELQKIPAIQLRDDSRFVLDRKVGLMREVIVNRRVIAGSATRLDRWEMRLVRAPRR
jgi:hypothetical protein